jgi:ferredoxin
MSKPFDEIFMQNLIGSAAEKSRTKKAMPDKVSSRTMVDVVCVDKLLNIRQTVRVPVGTVLLDALKQIEFMYGPCGGTGKCGRCVVEIEDGILVQSCYYRVVKNISVRKWRGF